MPYFGARVDLEKFYITVRIHGPLDHVPSGILLELKKFIPVQVETYDSNNIPEICDLLASDIKERYLDGTQLLWVQVELVTKQNIIFGASAEKIPEECLQ